MADSIVTSVIESRPALDLIGFSALIPPEEGYVRCPEFWEREYSRKYARLFRTMRPETPQEQAVLDNRIGQLALCLDGDGGFEYMIAGFYQGGPVPGGFSLRTLPAGDWAIFQGQGPLPRALQQLNDAIWREWFPARGDSLRPDTRMTLEYYTPGDPSSPDYRFAIWIPVRRADA